MLLYLEDKKIIAHKRAKPKFLRHAGRVWTTANILIDENKIQCTFDSRLGRCIYFQYNEVWYSISMYSEYCDKVQYSFNPSLGVIKFKTTQSVVVNTKLISVHKE